MQTATSSLLHHLNDAEVTLHPMCAWRAFQAWGGPDNHAHREWTDNESVIFELIERYGPDHNVGYTPLRFSWPADKDKQKIAPLSWADEWVLDIDDKEDFDRSIEITKTVHTHLVEAWAISPERISIWFSGRKGFHLVVPIYEIQGLQPDPLLYALLEEIRNELREELSLGADEIDTCFNKAIQIVRAPYTRHTGSGLYKVPVSPEVLDRESEAIFELAEGIPE